MKKWIIAVCNDAWDLIPNAEHIERNDAVANRLPDNYDDFSAAKTAMKAGVKLINDVEGIYKNLYIDTLENRKIICEYMSKHPEEVGKELIGIKKEN